MLPTRHCVNLAFALVLSTVAGTGATIAEPMEDGRALTPFAAREDLELAISAVEAALPDIYFHQSRKDWAAAKSSAREQVATVTDSEALWRILRPMLARIGEGHLSL